MRYRAILALTLAALLLAACRVQPTEVPPPATPTPVPLATISGTFAPAVGGEEVAGRQVALCRVEGSLRDLPAVCAVLPSVAVADEQGHFRFDSLAPGIYLFLVESGRGDFAAEVGRRAGTNLYPGNWPWLRDDLLHAADGVHVPVHLPARLPDDHTLDQAAYGLATLHMGDSPFYLAHTLEAGDEATQPRLLTIGVSGGDAAQVTIPVYTVAAVDYDALRQDIGPLGREESAQIDRALAARWQRFIDGDDSAYRDTDRRLIEAARSGALQPIGNAFFAAVEDSGDQLVKQPGYITIDVQSGETQIIAWLDEPTGDIVEAQTGYRLNVRDGPGVWIEPGPHGERYYHYGFSYYRRWGQVLPDPVIALIEDFYTDGVAHVSHYLSDYQEAAWTYREDMLGLGWMPDTLARMAAWQPSIPPFVRLPDSGTVDVRRERFLDAVIKGRVVVDGPSVEAFLRSEAARNGAFNQRPDRQEVIDALLIPYRSGHLFSDLEAAIILDATYGQDGEPLTIRISSGLEQGFMVPRYRDKEVLVSPDEVANVLLGYPGALNSRWPHEMAHIVEFRSEQYTFTGRPATGSRCEPVKYLTEFMWWVQRYPGDAPDWDWMPINSGLTLSRLLTEQFHNSGC